ncbi:MAG: PD-(D/E)XK nuclease family protein [Akkermansiaceae bacterium]|nr:PD-(D/E)XK nuclease family protein [Akkermansiaceae bacterium]
MEISISGVCERDMDLFLIEELSSDPCLLAWLYRRCGLGVPDFGRTRIRHSAVGSNGESDVEIHSFSETGRRMVLLIENKVAAAFQPLQAERYRMRAGNFLANGTADDAATLLFAPSRYIGQDGAVHGFDHCLSYEELADRICLSEEGLPRRVYKRTLLNAAANKSCNGYSPLVDGASSHFWHRYWEICRSMEPYLEMKEPRGNPSGSTFNKFRSQQLPRGLSIWHKFDRGFVELNFSGWGSRAHELRSHLAPILDPDMTVERTEKSAAIRLIVPLLEVSGCPEIQRVAVEKGITTAGRILRWMRSNESMLREIFAR